jgi:starch synthase
MLCELDEFSNNKSRVSSNKVTQWIVEHSLFAIGGIGKIYCDDPDNQSFTSDATNFALFSAAVAKVIISGIFGGIDILHLHDWHSEIVLLLLRANDPQYWQLQSIKTVYISHKSQFSAAR